ncbi:MAG: thiamine-monophosphate kinase [Planctomycetes bacterium]|nr:thiamine-monophosphate kinase [Planctomycetota bacterium]
MRGARARGGSLPPPATEDKWVSWLARAFRVGDPGGWVGVGDDAAVLPLAGGLLLTCDTKAEGTHFTRRALPGGIGHKALGSSLSDIAAMGGTPLAALLWVCASKGKGLRRLAGIARGAAALARSLGVRIVGGDTIASRGPLVVGAAVLGRVNRRPLLRSGARPGDRILVSGSLGGSSLGRHLTFTPRVRAGEALARRYRVRAAIDISDGLGRDLVRLCRASGCGARIEAVRIPVSPAARRLSRRTGRSAWRHALSDGEDFELLVAAAPREAARIARERPGGIRWTQIGECVAGASRIVLPGGRESPLRGEGYVHPL